MILSYNFGETFMKPLKYMQNFCETPIDFGQSGLNIRSCKVCTFTEYIEPNYKKASRKHALRHNFWHQRR